MPVLTKDIVPGLVQTGASARVAANVQPRFKIGDRIRVRNINPAKHPRLPRYVRGKLGTIELDHGVFVLPDTMAHGAGEIESTGASVQSFVRMLSAQLGRTVVDKTGLTGNYDYTLKWTPDDDAPAMARPDETAPSPNGGTEQNPSGPSLFTALEEQLGLKLESSKGPGDVIVIDHIELPTPN